MKNCIFLFKCHAISVLAILMLLFFVVINCTAQKKSVVESSKQYLIKYAKYDSVKILKFPHPDSIVVDKASFADKIVVLNASITNNYLQTIFPIAGFIDSKSLFSEKEIAENRYSRINKIKELDSIISGYSPHDDLINHNIHKSSEINFNHIWNKDQAHRVKIVRVPILNLRKMATKESDSLGFFRGNEKIIIDITNVESDTWSKVIYPQNGFVFKPYLFNDAELLEIKESEIDKQKRIEKSTIQTSVFQVNDKNKDLKSYQKQDSIIKPDIIKSNHTNILIVENKSLIPNDSVSIWWTGQQDYDKDNYKSSSVLNLMIKDKKKSKKKFKARIYSREKNNDDFQLIHTSKSFKANKPLQVEVLDNTDTSKRGNYNYRVDFYNGKNLTLISSHQYDKNELENNRQESIIQDTAGTGNKLITSNNEIRLIAAWSPVMLPIEKDFNRYNFPWGTHVEYSKSDWKFSIGAGFNSMQAKSDSKAYLLKTNTSFLYGKYTPLELFHNSLKFYTSAGLSFWNSKFKNIEHPEFPDYYPEEKANGFNLVIAAGTSFHYRNFFAGVQYLLFNSPKVLFGNMPIDPSNIDELQEYEPTTQYQLYSGSNHFQIIIGYQINF